MVITITKASISDVGKLQQIGQQTFFETFAETNSAENMKHYLEQGFAIEKLSREIENENSAFYFAVCDDHVSGYLKINFGDAQTEMKDAQSMEIERIYVQKEFHGKGVGQLLYDKAIEVAKQAQAKYVWLGVWERNPRAISFYKKNGFTEFGKHVFKLGDDEQTDIMMKLTL